LSLTLIVRIAVIVLVVVALLFALIWFGQRSLIYFPDTSRPEPPPGAAEVTLSTEDGLELVAWEYEPDAAADRATAVLVAPGNGGNRAGRAPLANALAAKGFTVLTLEYRGYGGNPGSPHEDGLRADARAAWDHLRESFDEDRIVLFGESLGGGVVANMAADGVNPAGIVLRSPFTSLAAAGRAHYPLLPVGLLLRDRYELAEPIAAVDVPVVVVYCATDEVIPAEQSLEVAESARAAGVDVTVVEVDALGHNDALLVAGPDVVDAVADLADGLGLTAGER
jgi:uncharacterized protein